MVSCGISAEAERCRYGAKLSALSSPATAASCKLVTATRSTRSTSSRANARKAIRPSPFPLMLRTAISVPNSPTLPHQCLCAPSFQSLACACVHVGTRLTLIICLLLQLADGYHRQSIEIPDLAVSGAVQALLTFRASIQPAAVRLGRGVAEAAHLRDPMFCILFHDTRLFFSSGFAG